jgi:hypothetical protein
MFFLARRWKRQPTGILHLDESNHFVNDGNLVGAWTWSKGGFRNLVNNAPTTRSAAGVSLETGSQQFGPFVAHRFSLASSGNIQLGSATSDFEFQSGAFSYCCLGRVNETGTTSGFLLGTRSSASANGYDLLYNSGSSPGRFQVRQYNGSVAQSATFDVNDAKFHFFTCGRSAADKIIFYIDQTLVDNTTAAITSGMTNSQALTLAKRGTVFAECSIGLVLVRKAETLFDKHLDLYENPWQLFRPWKRQVWIDVPAASAFPAHRFFTAL